MSILLQRKGSTAPLPRLEGKEVLIGPNPDIAKVKGVMFGGRKQFLVDTAGEDGFKAVLAKLPPRSQQYLKTPLASTWCEFEALIEVDKAIHETLKPKYPNVLALIGAASAELGIGKVYKMLDTAELAKFLESNALFHSQFQKFGRGRFEKTANGGRMIYTDYPCYSPIFCASAIGFFMESIYRHGGTEPSVTETKCQTLGDPSCTYEMTWK
jgi:predicted hydrocarbon binding protein